MAKLSMLISIVPSIRFRRVALNGGRPLSVAYDLTCIMTCCLILSTLTKNFINEAVDSTSIRSRRVVSNVGPHLSVACL